MKTNVRYIAIAMFTITTTIFGCKKDTLMPLKGDAALEKTTPPFDPNVDQEPIPNDALLTAQLMRHTWRVLAFKTEGDYGTDNTSRFTGYKFSFMKNNVVIAEKNGKGVTGKWNVLVDGKTQLALDFGVQPLLELNSQWVSFVRSENLIRLQKLTNGHLVHLDLIIVDKDVIATPTPPVN